MPLQLILQLLDDQENAAEPRQMRLYRLLKSAILDGLLSPGTRLPGSRQLATDQRMARNCVLFAYQQLLAEGFLEADRGGTRVAALPLTREPAVPKSPRPAATTLSQRARHLPPAVRGESYLPFAPGVPDLNAFPWPAWSRVLQRAWSDVSARQVAYAEPGGEPELRRAVAAFLSARRGVACTAEQVFIFPGGQAALDACARLLADTGDTVWLEDPCYTAGRNAMLAAGLKAVPVRVDEDGLVPDDVLWRASPPRLVYVTPSHQYPLGVVMSLPRRLALLAHAARSGAWILEDDYDSEFRYGRPPLPSLQGLDVHGRVIYLATFSKVIYPGLRLAYMVVPESLVESFQTGLSELYRGGQYLTQAVLADFIAEGHFVAHIRRMRQLYARRRQALLGAIRQHFGEQLPIHDGAAGLHLVLGLPPGSNDLAVSEQAMRAGVLTRPLSQYYRGAAPQPGLLLGYAHVDEADIPRHFATLAQVIRSLCAL